MVVMALLALCFGTLCGAYILPNGLSEGVASASDWVLGALMLSVGISIGTNKQIFQQLKKYNVRVLVIPFGVIVGSLFSGALLPIFLDDTIQEGLAIAAGMGWYSLSGIMLSSLIGVEAGTVAFLSSLIREILAFCFIPVLIKYSGIYSAIAAAGATSEDTTLPVIIRYGGDEFAIVSILNGILVSAAVPLSISFICK